MNKQSFATLLFAFVLAGCATVTAQSGDTIAFRLADELEENFLFPSVAQEYATYLRSNSNASISRFQTPEAYANSLTAQLQSVHPDGHLRVHYEPDEIQVTEEPVNQPLPRANAIDLATELVPDIAYLRMNLFPGDEATLAAVQGFVSSYAGSRNLIIDLRGHRGGGLAEMDVLFSNLFDVRTDLLQMDVREAVDHAGQSPIKDTTTTIPISGPAGVVRRQHVAIPSHVPSFLDAQVYVLTSNYTVSAAEHFAFALQRTNRATIVGEPTWGGAHFGGDVELGKNFYAFIPVGRTFDPGTGQSWEGSGVIPDIETTADNGLIEALVRIGVTRNDAVAIDANLSFKTPVRRPLGHQ